MTLQRTGTTDSASSFWFMDTGRFGIGKTPSGGLDVGGIDPTLYLNGVRKDANWDAAYTHKSNNGTDHSYIGQRVTTARSPQFAGIGLGAPADGSYFITRKNYARDTQVFLGTYSTNRLDNVNIYRLKSNHNTLGTLSATQSGDTFLTIYTQGVNTSNAVAYGRRISFLQDAAGGADYIPSRIGFWTGPSTDSIS